MGREYLPSHLAPLSMWPVFSDVGKHWVMENLGPHAKGLAFTNLQF